MVGIERGDTSKVFRVFLLSLFTTPADVIGD